MSEVTTQVSLEKIKEIEDVVEARIGDFCSLTLSDEDIAEEDDGNLAFKSEEAQISEMSMLAMQGKL